MMLSIRRLLLLVVFNTSCAAYYNGCDEDVTATFRLQLETDYYPASISWEVLDTSNYSVPIHNSTYDLSDLYMNFDTVLCLDSSKCFQFIISDSYYDGLCCDYGYGSYNISYNNEIIGGGSNYTYNETSILFGNCSSASPSQISTLPSAGPSQISTTSSSDSSTPFDAFKQPSSVHTHLPTTTLSPSKTSTTFEAFSVSESTSESLYSISFILAIMVSDIVLFVLLWATIHHKFLVYDAKTRYRPDVHVNNAYLFQQDLCLQVWHCTYSRPSFCYTITRCNANI